MEKMRIRKDSFRLNPITLSAVIAGLIAFVLTGGLNVLLWVAIGATLGAGLGWIVQRFVLQANTHAAVVQLSEYSSKAELQDEAARIGIDGRTHMTKDELAQAITVNAVEER